MKRCIAMRTNIVIDDSLICEAILLSGVKTKKETVEIALREFVQNRKRKSLFLLHRKKLIDPKYDYKKLRK
jgi:Arc/MetJ family transcription regulator